MLVFSSFKYEMAKFNLNNFIFIFNSVGSSLTKWHIGIFVIAVGLYIKEGTKYHFR